MEKCVTLLLAQTLISYIPCRYKHRLSNNTNNKKPFKNVRKRSLLILNTKITKILKYRYMAKAKVLNHADKSYNLSIYIYIHMYIYIQLKQAHQQTAHHLSTKLARRQGQHDRLLNLVNQCEPSWAAAKGINWGSWFFKAS